MFIRIFLFVIVLFFSLIFPLFRVVNLQKIALSHGYMYMFMVKDK